MREIATKQLMFKSYFKLQVHWTAASELTLLDELNFAKKLSCNFLQPYLLNKIPPDGPYWRETHKTILKTFFNQFSLIQVLLWSIDS